MYTVKVQRLQWQYESWTTEAAMASVFHIHILVPTWTAVMDWFGLESYSDLSFLGDIIQLEDKVTFRFNHIEAQTLVRFTQTGMLSSIRLCKYVYLTEQTEVLYVKLH